MVDVDGADGVTARPLRGDPPEIRVGTPCLVDYTNGARRLNIDAIALSSGPGGVILQLHIADRRRSPRYGQPMTVTIEVPGTGLGVIEGVAEDISLGGLRLRVPAHLPAGRRAFVSVAVADRDPILAAARILTCERTVGGLSHFARVEFTLVSAHDQARLFALMDWPATAPSATGSEWQISSVPSPGAHRVESATTQREHLMGRPNARHVPGGGEGPVRGPTAEDEATPAADASCVWAVAPCLTTVYASRAFSRLVGINRAVLLGQPWFVLLPATSVKAVDWLAHTPTTRATAILEMRHLDGTRFRVVLRRIYGGPGHDKAVFRVTALDRRETSIVVDATVSRVRSPSATSCPWADQSGQTRIRTTWEVMASGSDPPYGSGDEHDDRWTGGGGTVGQGVAPPTGPQPDGPGLRRGGFAQASELRGDRPIQAQSRATARSRRGAGDPVA